MLILKSSNNADKVYGVKKDNNGTNLFDDDDENIIDLYEQIENEELGICDLDDDEKNEIKQLKNNLIELCTELFTILNDNNCKLNENDKINLREYIDDALLWSYIHEKPTIIDFKSKIDAINNECIKIVENYKDTSIFVNDNINILVVRFKRIGDAILSLPLCHSLKLTFPNAKLGSDDKSVPCSNRASRRYL